MTNFFSTDCEILFRTSRTHTFQVLAGFCTGQLPFTFQVVWLRQKVTLFSKSDYKLGTLIKSITDVWFILDIQPFFAQPLPYVIKKILKIQNEAREGVEWGWRVTCDDHNTVSIFVFIVFSLFTELCSFLITFVRLRRCILYNLNNHRRNINYFTFQRCQIVLKIIFFVNFFSFPIYAPFFHFFHTTSMIIFEYYQNTHAISFNSVCRVARLS